MRGSKKRQITGREIFVAMTDIFEKMEGLRAFHEGIGPESGSEWERYCRQLNELQTQLDSWGDRIFEEKPFQ